MCIVNRMGTPTAGIRTHGIVVIVGCIFAADANSVFGVVIPRYIAVTRSSIPV